MNSATLRKRLGLVALSPGFLDELESLVEELNDTGAKLECVRPILELMESHPTLDFGAPGALVHFVEQFYGNGYEAELLSSLARRPTPHTIWMLNRIINGTEDPDDRKALLDAMELTRHHPLADKQTKEVATRFLSRNAANG